LAAEGKRNGKAGGYLTGVESAGLWLRMEEDEVVAAAAAGGGEEIDDDEEDKGCSEVTATDEDEIDAERSVEDGFDDADADMRSEGTEILLFAFFLTPFLRFPRTRLRQETPQFLTDVASE